MRDEEKAVGFVPLLEGAAGAVVSLLAAVVNVTVRIGEWLFDASSAMTPNV